MIITEAWSHPATGTFERKRVLDCSACSFTDYRRQIGRGSLTLKPYDSADDVVYVDPDDHTNDVDSVIRHYRANDGSGKELIAEWIASDEPDSASEGPTSISGSAIESSPPQVASPIGPPVPRMKAAAAAGRVATPPSGELVSMRMPVPVLQKNRSWPPGTTPSVDPCVNRICGA